MKRAALFFCAALACLAAPVAPAAADTTLTCYTQIPATMVSTVTSQSGYSGEVFRFSITQTTTSNGTTFPVGSTGYGVVLAAIPASNRARDGVVVLEPRFVLVDGQPVQVAGNPKDASILTHGTNPIAEGAGAIPVPGLGLAVDEAVKGTNITIGPGYNFHVIPIGNLQEQAPCTQTGS
ncbi:MAG: hypothetical protein JO199_12130 [Candidatus Eremiobacteraeota bacterium]|nr:hypothetical protein [Candidatus Eremiobacteraeota bacterium]